MEKQIITFSANEQTLTKTGGVDCYASNTVAYIEAHFDLGENWSGYDSVRAVWWNDYNKTVATVLDSAGTCIVPYEVLTRKGAVKVNLVGSIAENDVLTDRLTTCPVIALTIKCNAKTDGDNTQPITPSEYEQFVQTVKADADRAEAGAESAEASAQSASESATASANSATSSAQSATASAQSEQNASESAQSAENAKDDAEDARDKILGMRATATTLEAGSDATATYDSTNNSIEFGIPRGADGDVTRSEFNDLKSDFNTLDETVSNIAGKSATVTGNLIVVSDQSSHTAEITAQSAEVLHTGKNILAYPYDTPTSTGSGISWVVSANGEITASGTATANSTFDIVKSGTSYRRALKAGTYTFSGCPTGGSNSTYKMVIGITEVGEHADFGDGVTVTVPSDTTYYMYFRVYSGQTVSNLLIKPQIEVGTSKTEREQYISNSYTISGSESVTLYDGVNTFIANTSATIKYTVEKKSLISDVKEYGAVGDGVTDDTVALQTAINDCENRTLILSEGTYIFSSTLHINGQITIKGCGKQSVLKLANTFSLDAIDWRPDQATSKSKFKYPFICVDADNCILENFTLEGQTTAFKDENEDGITVQGTNHIISNLTVFNINYFKDLFTSRNCLCPAWGIDVFNASNVLVTNCHVYDCGYECIGTENCDNVTITESQFGDGCQTSTQIHRKSKRIKFTGNYVYQTENVRSVNCPSFTMDANPNTDEEMDDILALGNTLMNHVNTVAGGENNVRIQDNYIKGVMSSNQHVVYPNGLLISGNKIDGRINMCADNAYVYGNIINNDTQNYMIRIYGNNSAETANHGIGIGNGTTIVTH